MLDNEQTINVSSSQSKTKQNKHDPYHHKVCSQLADADIINPIVTKNMYKTSADADEASRVVIKERYMVK